MSDPDIIDLCSDSDEEKSFPKEKPPKAEIIEGKKRVPLITLKRKLGEDSSNGHSIKNRTKFDRIKTTTDTSQNQQRRATLQPVQSSTKVGLSARTHPMTSLPIKTKLQVTDENSSFFLDRSTSTPSSTVTSGEYIKLLATPAGKSFDCSNQDLKTKQRPISIFAKTLTWDIPEDCNPTSSSEASDENLDRSKARGTLLTTPPGTNYTAAPSNLHQDNKLLLPNFSDIKIPTIVTKKLLPNSGLDRFNAVSSVIQPHYKHGKLSNNAEEQLAREELLDWLVKIETARLPVQDDKKLEELMVLANWGQQRRKNKLEVKFATSIPGSSVKGYYVNRSNGRHIVPSSLSSHYSTKMRAGISQAIQDRNQSYRNPLYESLKDSQKDSVALRPPLDILYVSTLFPPDQLQDSLMETVMDIEPIQEQLFQDYPGSFGGNGQGNYSMRHNHFNSKNRPSEIYKRTVGSSNPMVCVEKKVILCDSISTKELGEGFLMAFGTFYNKKHKLNRFIITDCAAPRMDDLTKAKKYVEDGVPMFKVLEEGEKPHPPPWATIEDITTLPYTLSPEDLILRYDPNRPDLKAHYKSFQNMEQLVEEFGDPPPSYFVTMKDDRDEFKAQFEMLKAEESDS